MCVIVSGKATHALIVELFFCTRRLSPPKFLGSRGGRPMQLETTCQRRRAAHEGNLASRGNACGRPRNRGKTCGTATRPGAKLAAGCVLTLKSTRVFQKTTRGPLLLQNHMRAIQNHVRAIQNHVRTIQNHVRATQNHVRAIQNHVRTTLWHSLLACVFF